MTSHSREHSLRSGQDSPGSARSLSIISRDGAGSPAEGLNQHHRPGHEALASSPNSSPSTLTSRDYDGNLQNTPNGSTRQNAASDQQVTSPTEVVNNTNAADKLAEKPLPKRRTHVSRFIEKSLSFAKSTYSSYCKDWWALEILGVLFSIACLIAIVVTLLVYRNRPLAAWTMPISINSLVSLFAALAKSAVLFPVAACIGQLKWPHFVRSSRSLLEIQRFDDASRGPAGALELIFRLGGGSLIATFGGVLTFAALAIDPFAQQIISFPSRPVSFSNDTATIAASQIYDTGASDYGGAISSSFTDVQMQGAIYRGLYSLPGDTPFQCGSGSCNWPTFASLGSCSSCVNVTAETQRTCYNQKINSSGGLTSELEPHDPNKYAPLQCNYTTPENFNLWARSSMNGEGPLATVINSTARMHNTTDESNAIMMRLAILRLPDNPTSFDLPFGEVHECQLSWCVRSFSNVKVVNGGFQSGDAEVLPLTLSNGSVWFGPSSDTANLVYGVYKTQRSPSDDRFNDTFTINVGDDATTAFFLTGLFTIAQMSFAAYTSETGKISISRALQKAESIPQLMETLASSMSDRIRSSANATQIRGTAYQSVTFIHVRWAWLALPVALIFCACALLTLMIILTSKLDSVLWKSSSLALLFHGLEHQRVLSGPINNRPNDNDEDWATKKLSEMEGTAAKLRVQLLRDGSKGDLRLVREN